MANSALQLSGRSLCRGDHSCKRVIPSVVYLSVIAERHRRGLGPLGLSSREKKRK